MWGRMAKISSRSVSRQSTLPQSERRRNGSTKSAVARPVRASSRMRWETGTRTSSTPMAAARTPAVRNRGTAQREPQQQEEQQQKEEHQLHTVHQIEREAGDERQPSGGDQHQLRPPADDEKARQTQQQACRQRCPVVPVLGIVGHGDQGVDGVAAEQRREHAGCMGQVRTWGYVKSIDSQNEIPPRGWVFCYQ